MSDRMDINSLLLEMRNIKSQSQAFGGIKPIGQEALRNNEVQNVNGPKFGDLFSQAINKVNDVQQASSATASAYMQGDKSIDITDVMIASQP